MYIIKISIFSEKMHVYRKWRKLRMVERITDVSIQLKFMIIIVYLRPRKCQSAVYWSSTIFSLYISGYIYIYIYFQSYPRLTLPAHAASYILIFSETWFLSNVTSKSKRTPIHKEVEDNRGKTNKHREAILNSQVSPFRLYF